MEGRVPSRPFGFGLQSLGWLAPSGRDGTRPSKTAAVATHITAAGRAGLMEGRVPSRPFGFGLQPLGWPAVSGLACSHWVGLHQVGEMELAPPRPRLSPPTSPLPAGQGLWRALPVGHDSWRAAAGRARPSWRAEFHLGRAAAQLSQTNRRSSGSRSSAWQRLRAGVRECRGAGR